MEQFLVKKHLMFFILPVVLLFKSLTSSDSFLIANRCNCRNIAPLEATKNNEEYSNPLTSFLGNFLNEEQQATSNKLTIDKIDWNVKKAKFSTLPKLASRLEQGISKREWFVTGLVEPALFSENFSFQDPDVKLKGIRAYAEGVNKLFDQSCSRAEVIKVEVTDPVAKVITVTWRLEGKVRVGPGINIKPYIVYTDFKVDQEGLICFQEDRFSIPGYDILLSAFFPFLIPFLTPPAPPAEQLRASITKRK